MTFEEWWKTADDDDIFGSGDAVLFARDAWNAALEEAAKLCEQQQWFYGGRSHSQVACNDCAEVIRKARSTP